MTNPSPLPVAEPDKKFRYPDDHPFAIFEGNYKAQLSFRNLNRPVKTSEEDIESGSYAKSTFNQQSIVDKDRLAKKAKKLAAKAALKKILTSKPSGITLGSPSKHPKTKKPPVNKSTATSQPYPRNKKKKDTLFDTFADDDTFGDDE